MGGEARDQLRRVTLSYLKKGGLTPEYINMPIPTDPIRLRFGPMRGTSSTNVGSGVLMGSKTLVGSPNDIMFQLTKLRLNTSTPNVYFVITHSRFHPGSAGQSGTVDVPYLPTRADDLTVTDLQTPIHSFPPGTLRIYAMGPGSPSQSPGKGSTIKFRGFGSSQSGGAAVSMDLYPL